MNKIKSSISKSKEQVTGHAGLFAIAVLSWACEHNIVQDREPVLKSQNVS